MVDIRAPYADILRTLAAPNVHLHGAYEPGSAHQCLRTADVALFLSIWPETYLLTLSEAWCAGVVPIVTDIGAPGERVAHRVNGLKVPVNDPASVVDALRELVADRQELERLRAGVHPGLYRTTAEHVRRLSERYEHLLGAYGIRVRPGEFFSERPRRRLASAGNVFRMANTWRTPDARAPSPSPPDLLADAPPGSHDGESKAYWRKVIPYLRAHGIKATVRRTGEKICGRLKVRLHE